MASLALRRTSLLVSLARQLQPPVMQQPACAAVWQRGVTGSAWTRQQDDAPASGSSWLPGWAKSRLPSVLGGTKDTDELENLTLDSFATTLKRARQLGGLTGFAYGTTAANDPAAKGTMRMFENIIGAMREEEKEDLSQFNAVARARVAGEVGCSTSQVDDCIARYLFMKSMTSKMAQLKREGKELPKTVEEVESMVGSWRQYKSELAPAAGEGGSSDAAGGVMVPLSAKGPKGVPCPLAGSSAGKNTKCPLTRKAFKSCCGRRLA